MADIQISSLPSTNNISNNDILLINQGGADYSVSVNNLLSSVNDNINTVNTTLTTAVSQIDQRMKTLFVPLNYGQFFHNGSTNIPNNGDLNEYLTPGVYYITDSSIGNTIVNGPNRVNCCGTLIVYSQFGQSISNSYAWQYITQELRTNDGAAIFIRNINSGATAGVYFYGAWRCVTAQMGQSPYGNTNWHPSNICGQLPDGKFIYCKYITFQPNVSTNTGGTQTVDVDTGLNLNAYDILDVRVTARNTGNAEYILPHVVTANDNAGFVRYSGQHYISGTTLSFKIANDTWGSGWTFRCLIYYTIL